MPLPRLSFLLLLLALSCNTQALTIEVDGSFVQQNIGQGVEFLVDPAGTLTADTVNQQTDWQISTVSALNFGFTPVTYWIRFSIRNISDKPIDLLVENRYPFLDHLDFTVWSGQGPRQQHALGDSQPYSSRSVKHSNFLVPLEVPAQGEARLLLRVQTASVVQVPLTLWEKQAFLEQDHVRSIYHGVLYGLVLSIALYHVLLFFSIREKAFLHYALFNFSLVVTFMSMHGFPSVILGDLSLFINDKILLLAMSGCAIFSVLFTYEVLEVRETRPRLAWALRAVAYAACLMALLTFLLPYSLLIRGMVLLSLATTVVNVVTHVRRFLDGYPPARYILLAAMAAAVGAGITLLEKVALLPTIWLTENILHICIVTMTMLFSFALSYRMNMDRRMREEAQAELITSQRQTNENLDRMVRERTEALELANAQLTEVSNTDALTGLRNRRYFNEAFELEFKRAFREKTPLSLLLLDIDHFKKINDTYGHPFGDVCLAQTAQIIRSLTRRPPDVTARYGGEEFAMLLPNTHEEGARHIATQICHSLSEATISDGQVSIRISASIGVATLKPGPEDSPETLLKRVDLLLYRAKENGRNRVEWEV